MRLMLVLAVAAAAMLINVRAGQAYEGPWCAVQDTGFGAIYQDCTKQTIEECRRDVIAGNRGFCTQNSRWPGYYGVAIEEPRSYRRHRRHKRRARHY